MKQSAWYVFGKLDGETKVLSGHNTEAEAFDIGMNTNFDNGLFEVKHYPTTNQARAVQMWKYEQAKKTGDLRMSMRPIGHGVK